MNKASYLIPAEPVETEYEVKKSRFIARLQRVRDRQQAMRFLEQARKDYPDARHHCWAYLIGSPKQPETVAMSDDGEPSGTAGKPILNVLQHKDVGDVMVVIIRYFGGIKLGAGGLVRAYSQASQRAYDHLKTTVQEFLASYTIRCDFAEEQSVRHWLQCNGGQIDDTEYSAQVILKIKLPEALAPQLSSFLAPLQTAELLESNSE